MKTLYQFCWLGLVMVLAQACKKDNGNYNYNETNKLSINVGAESFTVQQLAVLNINPDIKESISGSGPFTYKWTAYKPKDIEGYKLDLDTAVKGTQPVLISQEKNLNSSIRLSPGEYFLQYTVTDTKTGIASNTRYKLVVNGVFYEGWLVMSNVNNNAQLSYIRSDDQIFPDPVQGVNAIGLSGKAIGAYAAIIAGLQEVNVFTEGGVYRFGANDFVLTGKTPTLFETPMTFKDAYYSLNSINTDQYIVNNGRIYATIAPNFGVPGKYSEPFNGPDHEVFPFFIGGTRVRAMFYDNKNKRFLQAGYNSRTLSEFGNITGAKYDLRAVDKTLLFIDRGPANEYMCIMKDDTKYYYYSVLPNSATPAGTNQEMLGSPAISQATTIATSLTLQHLYYGAGNKVYLYDVQANSSRLVYEFPTNYTIKDMEMYKGKGWGVFTSPLFSRRLVVATTNSGAGEVYYLDLTATGDLVRQTFSKKFTGFGDIVQINYRNPNE